jgi:hypothetical protein
LGIATKKLQVNFAAQDWLSFLSSGGLIYPCDELISVATVMDETFSEMHGSSLSHEKYIFNKLVNNTMLKLGTTPIPHEVMLCLSRMRTYIRLRDINRKISFSNCKSKLEKKICKFTNSKRK